MYNLTKKEKLNFILEKTAELEVSAYEISKNTTLTEAGVQRILNKKVNNPHENTLNTILEYLESKVLGSEIGKVKEPEEKYNSTIMEEVKNNPLIICLNEKNKLTMEVLKLQNLLRKNNINFVNIFEEE